MDVAPDQSNNEVENVRRLARRTKSLDELKQLVILYHKHGLYEQAEEIYGVIIDLENKSAAPIHRDVA